MSIGSKLAQARKAANLTQEQLAERLLRENGIRPAGTPGLARRLEDCIGKTMTIFGEDGEGVACRVLDVDGDWVLVRAREGKKREQEFLFRLDGVKNIKVK